MKLHVSLVVHERPSTQSIDPFCARAFFNSLVQWAHCRVPCVIITACAPGFRVRSSRSWRKSAASRAPARATTNVDVDGDNEADDGSNDLSAAYSELGLHADTTPED